MSAIPVKIMLHGLIALVPVGGPGPVDHMTALLVDARNPPARECLAPHQPRLQFRPISSAQCVEAGCVASATDCTCTDAVVGKEISLEISPIPVLPGQNLREPLPGPIPEKVSEAGLFGYIANLAAAPLSATLNPMYLASPLPESARQVLLARMQIPFREVTACSLARREEGGELKVHAMGFRQLGVAGQPDEKTQAVAQMVVADLEVPDVPAGSQVVRLRLRDFSGTDERVVELRPGIHGYLIELSNAGPELDRDAPCDDGVARHFALFYDLAENPPALEKRLIPYVRLTQAQLTSTELKPPACDHPTFNASARPICPMATFQ